MATTNKTIQDNVEHYSKVTPNSFSELEAIVKEKFSEEASLEVPLEEYLKKYKTKVKRGNIITPPKQKYISGVDTGITFNVTSTSNVHNKIGSPKPLQPQRKLIPTNTILDTPLHFTQRIEAEREAEELLDKLDDISQSFNESKRKRTTITLPYHSKYNFFITTYFNMINNNEDYHHFLKELQVIKLGALPSYSQKDPKDKMVSDMSIFAINNRDNLLTNPYNLLLFYLYRFGINIYGDKKNHQHKIEKLVNGLFDSIRLTDKELKKIIELCKLKVDSLFNIILFPHTFIGSTKEEFVVMYKYIQKNDFTIISNSETIKEINSISALNFVLNNHSFNMDFNFLTKEVFIKHFIGQDNLFCKNLDSFTFLVKDICKFDKNSSCTKSPKIYNDKININNKKYSKELFEEMVESNFETFLTNLKFEEENYETRMLEKTI